MTGTLYLCATPIGNLQDITYRVAQTLAEVDLIAAEDTRNSGKLLNRLDIHTPMTSYHEYNRTQKARTLVDKLLAGKNIALISDAGTPVISDPGEVLVRLCQEAGIPVTSLPGASACITALTLSGLDARRFVFEGFLPAKEDKKERRRVLESLKTEHRTIVLYAAPHDLERDLADLYAALGEREVVLCRELTKKFEEVVHTTLGAPCTITAKGEFVLVLAGAKEEVLEKEAQAAWEGTSVLQHVERLEKEGASHKDALKIAAAERGVTKRTLYAQLLKEEGKA